MMRVFICCLTSFLFLSIGADETPQGKANHGILNGPLTRRKKIQKTDPLVALKRAIDDLIATNGEAYPDGNTYLERLAKINSAEDPSFDALKREALLANPLLDFDNLLVVKRKGLSMPNNWKGNSGINGRAKTPENELMRLSLKTGTLSTVYKPDTAKYVGQFDLHFDADKVLFSSLADNGSWDVFEIKIDKNGTMVDGSLRQVTTKMGKDLDNYDPVYLPNGTIIFISSGSYSGVPCVGGKEYVGNLYVMDADGNNVRRLTFEQDNDWNPVVTPDGKVLYLRWEYTDSAHYFSRVMMKMNPDGTDQKGFYGSNSYWPNSMFFPKPIPGSTSKFIAIVGSHHGRARAGALVLFDAAKGRNEADGAVQIIGESGHPVEPLVVDRLSRNYNPSFLTPYPLSAKYFLASVNQGGWKICLVDVFDNMLILKDEPGWALLEPVPLKPTKTPPVVPDKVRLDQTEATLWISDIHTGPGLRGIPKGTAKALRIYGYEYAPRNAGSHYAMGMETCWDARVLLGTVPLEKDGSVMVKIPANRPLSVQPLDKDGKALQLMRSWLVAMPGEVLSCIGCHESPNETPPAKVSLAARRGPQVLKDWYGKPRGFSYTREVQPVIDKNCVGCHSPQAKENPKVQALVSKSNLRVGTGKETGKLFKEVGLPDLSEPRKSHTNLHPYVRRNGPEGDYHVLTPMEFHADTSPLIQMVQKGHHNVKLDAEAWDRLVTWIDLNAPFHGTWSEARPDRKAIIARRIELRKQYTNSDFDPEVIHNPYTKNTAYVMPEPVPPPAAAPEVNGWPFDEKEAVRKQGNVKPLVVDLGNGESIKLVRVPAGQFAMGSTSETPVEQPVHLQTIDAAFWMGTTEITLGQYRQFDPDYLNGVYDMHYKDQVKRGYYMNDIRFPVIRVTWEKANAFCAWLSAKTGKTVKLPTEAQWEWACRAGSDTPFYYGDLDADFSGYGNMADKTKKQLAVKGVNPKPIKNPRPHIDYELKDNRFDDKVLHLAPVGTYKPNAWGLYDMHGNVAEWTSSPYAAYAPVDGDEKASDKRVVRGGSWNDRPFRSSSSYRLGYPEYHPVYNVGFRVIITK